MEQSNFEGNALSTLARGGAIAYGKCYIWDFGGYVNAIDLETGTLSWTYVPKSVGYDTPYGIYPFWHFGSHSIADGKLFLSESRMYDPPLFPDAHRIAINCTDGSLVWSVLDFDGREPSAIADGYLVAWNSYDCQIYTFGKGPTSTEANVQQNVVPFGDKCPNHRQQSSMNPQAQKTATEQLASQMEYQQSLTKAKVHGWNTSTCNSQNQTTQQVFQLP